MSGQRSHPYVACFLRIKIAESPDVSPSPCHVDLQSHLASRGRVGYEFCVAAVVLLLPA